MTDIERFDANEWVTSFVNLEEVMEIKVAFDLFDIGKDGSIRPKCISISFRI